MDPVHNPYRPGAGRRPPALAGRDALLTAFDVVVRRSEELGEGDRGWILNGLRGVGKTVLLNELLRRAGERDWITAKVEAGAGESLPVALSQALVRGMRTATGRHPESRLRRMLGVFKAFSVKADATGMVSLGVEVEPIRGVADSGRFAEDLAALFEVMGETARELGIGVLILVDELQEADVAELAAINTALHHLGQAEMPLPLMLVGAGLPSLPAQLADATSYAERLYDYRPVGLLDRPAAVDALTIPTRALGVEWDAEALTMAADVAGGYPYFLQAIGKHVWDNAISSPISADDVWVGLHDARREVDDGLYRSRWERATPAQRDLLRALADLAGDGPATVSALASRMHKSRASDLSVARNELIKKGLVYPPERGMLAFTVPGMHEFVLRQDVQEVDSTSIRCPTVQQPSRISISLVAAARRPRPAAPGAGLDHGHQLDHRVAGDPERGFQLAQPGSVAVGVGHLERHTAIEGDGAVAAEPHARRARRGDRAGQHLKQRPHRRRAEAATQIPQRLVRRRLAAAHGGGEFGPHLAVAQPGKQTQRQHEIHAHRDGSARNRRSVVLVSASTASTSSTGICPVNSPMPGGEHRGTSYGRGRGRIGRRSSSVAELRSWSTVLLPAVAPVSTATRGTFATPAPCVTLTALSQS